MGWWTVYCQLLTLWVLSRMFHNSTSVINLTMSILQDPRLKMAGRSRSSRGHVSCCGEAVNNSVKGFHPLKSKEYFHEIYSRFRIIVRMPILSSSNSMLWSYTGFLSVQKSLLNCASKKRWKTASGLARWPLAGLVHHCVLSVPSSETSRWRGWTETHVTWEGFHTAKPGQVSLRIPLFQVASLNRVARNLLTPS